MIYEEPVGPTLVPQPHSISDLPPLILGGTAFNYQFNAHPEELPAEQLLDLAFQSGLIALDTSPYYGPSEVIMGKTLKKLQPKWARESYFICTKAGRIALDEFDYSADAIKKSVLRSCERLHTDYLDLVYLHDIEFVEEKDIYGGLKQLKQLQRQGIVRNIGVTGYPVEFLFKVAMTAAKDDEIGPLDAVLSYCNGCIQNTKLFDYYNKFLEEAKVKKIMNGSILSMSMLRSGSTHSFHPAPEELKLAVADSAKMLLQEHNTELAELSTRFAMKKWLFNSKKGTNNTTNNDNKSNVWNKNVSVVIGVSSVEELRASITNYWRVMLNMDNEEDEKMFNKVRETLGEHINETWSSGIH